MQRTQPRRAPPGDGGEDLPASAGHNIQWHDVLSLLQVCTVKRSTTAATGHLGSETETFDARAGTISTHRCG